MPTASCDDIGEVVTPLLRTDTVLALPDEDEPEDESPRDDEADDELPDDELPDDDELPEEEVPEEDEPEEEPDDEPFDGELPEPVLPVDAHDALFSPTTLAIAVAAGAIEGVAKGEGEPVGKIAVGNGVGLGDGVTCTGVALPPVTVP